MTKSNLSLKKNELYLRLTMYKIFFFIALFLITNSISAQMAKGDKSNFIIKKHLQAIGGETNWNKLKTLKLKYSITSEGKIINRTIFYDVNLGLRETYSAMGRDGQEKSNLRLLTKDTSVQSAQVKNDIILQPIEKKQAQKLLSDLDFLSPFINYEKQKRTINYQGQEHVLGIDYHKFIVYYPSGKAEYIYINPKTYLIERIYLSSSQYEAYQTLEEQKRQRLNLVFANQIETEKGIMQLKEIKINEDLPKDIFNISYRETE